jgi:hypothetical protein
MNVYGDIVTDEMEQASGKVAVLALTDRATDRNDANWIEKWRKRVGVERFNLLITHKLL